MSSLPSPITTFSMRASTIFRLSDTGSFGQPNRQGITRLDSYYDPNDRKYYITPQSVEAVIQEEIQWAKKSVDAPDSERFGSAEARMKHPETVLSQWVIESFKNWNGR